MRKIRKERVMSLTDEEIELAIKVADDYPAGYGDCWGCIDGLGDAYCAEYIIAHIECVEEHG
jgi:hypothetical protein